jgi:hypothetical protein
MKERDELKEALASQTQRVRELEEERDNCAKAEAWRLESARRELLERERQKERERERERQKQQDKEEAIWLARQLDLMGRGGGPRPVVRR